MLSQTEKKKKRKKEQLLACIYTCTDINSSTRATLVFRMYNSMKGLLMLLFTLLRFTYTNRTLAEGGVIKVWIHIHMTRPTSTHNIYIYILNPSKRMSPREGTLNRREERGERGHIKQKRSEIGERTRAREAVIILLLEQGSLDHWRLIGSCTPSGSAGPSCTILDLVRLLEGPLGENIMIRTTYAW